MFQRPTLAGMAISVPLLGLAAACSSTPASPFDTMKTAPITAYRLQNYEPPPQATAVPTAPGMLPGMPAEIQQWIQAGASMLPPGLLPPGLLPGQPAAPTPPTAVDTTPRFHGFRVLGQQPVVDDKLRSQLIDLFGYSKNFTSQHSPCVYAEFGFSFARIGQPPADVLVSLSCNQVQAQNFVWPHGDTGLSPDSVQSVSKISQSIFGYGG
jgi:hypothetical protein